MAPRKKKKNEKRGEKKKGQEKEKEKKRSRGRRGAKDASARDTEMEVFKSYLIGVAIFVVLGVVLIRLLKSKKLSASPKMLAQNVANFAVAHAVALISAVCVVIFCLAFRSFWKWRLARVAAEEAKAQAIRDSLEFKEFKEKRKEDRAAGRAAAIKLHQDEMARNHEEAVAIARLIEEERKLYVARQLNAKEAEMKAEKEQLAAQEKERKDWEVRLQWTDSEHAQFELALRAVPSSAAMRSSERWARIAAMLPGKTVHETLCYYNLLLKRRQRQDMIYLKAVQELEEQEKLQKESEEHAYMNAYSEDEDDWNDDKMDEVLNPEEVPKERGPLLKPELEPRSVGVRIEFGVMEFWNIAYIRPHTMAFHVGCGRCGQAVSVTLSGIYQRESCQHSYCNNCAATIKLTLHSTLLHINSSPPALCYVSVENCGILDVLPSQVSATCDSCNSDMTLPPLQRGRRVEMNCHQCHQKLSFQMKSINMVDLDGRSKVGNAKKYNRDEDEKGLSEFDKLLRTHRKKNASYKQQLGIIAGRPLPGNGACKHFRKSMRWLRFSCCGRAYPCPVCHELSDCPAAQAGQQTMATRMICGKCSHEQPFANKACEECDFKMGLNKSRSAHWAGGAGSRDITMLSKKDSRKKRGLHKTVSNKKKRVGLEGKKQREKAKSLKEKLAKQKKNN